MNHVSSQSDPQLIETIVRMVVERLRATGTNTESRPPQPAEDSHVHDKTRTLSDRVITLAQLRNDMSGVTTLQVGKKALVTPAVLDELKDRGIVLERCDEIALDSASRGPTAHLPAHGRTIQNRRDADLGVVKRSIDDRQRRTIRSVQVVTIDQPACQSTAQTLTATCRTQSATSAPSTRELVRLARERSTATSLVVIVTCDPFQALWECHQQRLRSAPCRTAADVAEAMTGFAAAALVIDGRCGLSHDLVAAIAQTMN